MSSRLEQAKGRREARSLRPFPLPQVSPARKELLTTAQRALEHLLKPSHLERLRQHRPVAIGLGQLAIYERRAARPLCGVFLLRTSNLRRLRGWGGRTRTGESARELSDALVTRGTPFIFATGYGEVAQALSRPADVNEAIPDDWAQANAEERAR
jgi:hypothetical protein